MAMTCDQARTGQWRTALAAWFSLSGICVGAESRVVIETEPAIVVRRTFDPEHPTDDMPPLTPPEVGLCISEFSCEMKMSTVVVEGRPMETKIEAIRMITRLKLTIWTRVLAPEREIRHEEAHRAISESYYRNAEAVARRLAEEVVDRRLFRVLRKRQIKLPRANASIQAACDALEGRLLEEYLAETHWRCAFAQECFDEITDHGRNDISETEAVARAIAEEAAHERRGVGGIK